MNIWTPNGSHRVPSSGQPLFHTIISLGFQDIYGEEPTEELLAERLSGFSLGQVLEITGRVSAILDDETVENRREIQKGILQGLTAEKGRFLWRRYLEESEKPEFQQSQGVVLFHELQIVNLAKAAFLLLDPVLERRSGDPADLVDALLIITDLMQRSGVDLGALPVGSEERMQAATLFTLANGLFYHKKNPMQALVRSHALFLEDAAHLRHLPQYVDLPVRAQEITGFEANALTMTLYGLSSYWYNISLENAHERSGVLDARTHFSRTLPFTEEESEKMVGLIAVPASEMREAIQREYSLDDLRPHHMLPFAKNPLIRFDQKVVTASTRLLQDKLIWGLYHLYLDPTRTEKAQRSEFQTYIGHRFGDYLGQLLQQQFPPAAKRLVLDEELREEAPDYVSMADALIIYADLLIVVEGKARPLPMGVRTGSDFDALEEKVDDVFVAALNQIDSSIEWLEDGGLETLSLPQRRYRYIPLLVTLDDLPLNPYLWNLIDLRWQTQKEEYEWEDRRFSWQAMDIGDFELTISIVERQGLSLGELLKEKGEDARQKGNSLRNFLYDTHRDALASAVPREQVRERFSEIVEEVLDRMRGEAKQ